MWLMEKQKLKWKWRRQITVASPDFYTTHSPSLDVEPLQMLSRGHELKGKPIYLSADIAGCSVYSICASGAWEWPPESNMRIYFFSVGGLYDGCKKITVLLSAISKSDRHTWNFAISELDEIRNYERLDRISQYSVNSLNMAHIRGH